MGGGAAFLLRVLRLGVGFLGEAGSLAPRRLDWQHVNMIPSLPGRLPYLSLGSLKGTHVDVEFLLQLSPFVTGRAHVRVAHGLSYRGHVNLRVGQKSVYFTFLMVFIVVELPCPASGQRPGSTQPESDFRPRCERGQTPLRHPPCSSL